MEIEYEIELSECCDKPVYADIMICSGCNEHC
jgi:hypothetical protein